MVGARKKCGPMAPAITQQQTLSSRRWAHRRIVDGSGKRDGSLQCGAACSAESPAADPLAGLPSTLQGVVPRRRQPIWQDREGLLARLTDSAPHPHAGVPIIVALTKSPSVADDGVVLANRTSPAAQEILKGDHPGSMLSFSPLRSAIKRITAGVEARR